jgi:alcohol dehydrogenase
MKAVIFDGVGSVKVGDAPKPDLQTSKDALIRVTHASICGSDLHILSGRVTVEKNVIIGHEGVGVVEKTGSDVIRVKPGDRVAVSVTIQCGECINCRNGQVALCKNGGMFGHGKGWGGFPGTQAEYMRIPYADMVLEPIPADLTEEQAIFVGDILSTGYMACENGSVRPGDVVAIWGAGPVGLCTVASARLFGASRIVSVDLLNYRLEAAKRLGADIVINPTETDVAKETKKITGGRGADVTIEAIGSPEALNSCLESVKGGGNISIVGVFSFDKVEISIREMLRRRLQIRAALVNMVNMGRLMSLIKGGKLDLTPLITHRMPLSKAEEAYRIFSSRSEDVLKVLLYP